MKKFVTLLLAALSAVVICVCAGCTKDGGNVKRTKIDEYSSVILVASDDVLKLEGDVSLKDYLDALKSKGELDFKGENGSYGYFLNSLDGKDNEVISTVPAVGYSWMIYIDFLTLDGVPYASDYAVCEYNGQTLYSASYGVSGIPCVEGHTYAFVYEYYNYGN